MPELNHVVKQEDLKKELLVQALDNCYKSMKAGMPYKLDDDMRVFVLTQLNPNPLEVEDNYLVYYGHIIEHFGASEEFELRGEKDIQREINLLSKLEAKLAGVKVLYAIANVIPEMVEDKILLKLYISQRETAPKFGSSELAFPRYFTDTKKIEIFNAIPKEQQKMFPFSKELEELANEQAKSSDPKASESPENICDTPDIVI